MDKRDYYKYLFIIGALWNWVASFPFIVIVLTNPNMLLAFGLAVPPSLIWSQLFLASVFLLGIGYFLVGKDIDSNHAVVLIGALDKILVFFVFVYYFTVGDVPLFLVLLGTGDLIFAILFLEFLINFDKL
jgi:hypothetical protein